jgi:carboxyl-terminal processing protease
MHASASEANEQSGCRLGNNPQMSDTLEATLLGSLNALSAATKPSGENQKPQKKERNYQAEAWQSTGLDLSYLQTNVMPNETCGQNERIYLACVSGINTLLNAQSDISAAFVPKSFYEKNPGWFKGKPKPIGNYVLAEIIPSDANDASDSKALVADLKKRFAFRDAMMMASVEYFRAKKPLPDFKKLIGQARIELQKKDPGMEGISAAIAWNAFLHVQNDPHTNVLLLKNLESADPIFGIGAQVEKTKKGIILHPLEGSPAERSGLQSSDTLVGVDQVDVSQKTVEDASKLIRGEPGTQVKLTVLRKGQKVEIPVERDQFTPKNITFKILNEYGQKVAHIKFEGFLRESCDDMRATLINAQDQGADAIELDLRDNAGGIVDEAVCIASLFIGPDKEIVTLDRRPMSTSFSKVTDLPLVVLTNSRSASASEILSSTLQDYERAWIVGERTYGKGSFQGVTQVPGYQDIGFAKTDGLYVLASGRSPQLVGVSPDFEVFRDPADKDEGVSSFLREDAQFLPLQSTPQPYKTLSNRSELRSIRQCLQDRRAASSFERLTDSSGGADFQLLTGLEVLDCQRKSPGSIIGNWVKKLSQSGDCKMTQEFLNFVKTQSNQSKSYATRIDRLLSSNPDYEKSVDYYLAQKRLAESDLSDELAPVKSQIDALRARCGFNDPLETRPVLPNRVAQFETCKKLALGSGLASIYQVKVESFCKTQRSNADITTPSFTACYKLYNPYLVSDNIHAISTCASVSSTVAMDQPGFQSCYKILAPYLDHEKSTAIQVCALGSSAHVDSGSFQSCYNASNPYLFDDKVKAMKTCITQAQ